MRTHCHTATPTHPVLRIVFRQVAFNTQLSLNTQLHTHATQQHQQILFFLLFSGKWLLNTRLPLNTQLRTHCHKTTPTNSVLPIVFRQMAFKYTTFSEHTTAYSLPQNSTNTPCPSYCFQASGLLMHNFLWTHNCIRTPHSNTNKLCPSYCFQASGFL